MQKPHSRLLQSPAAMNTATCPPLTPTAVVRDERWRLSPRGAVLWTCSWRCSSTEAPRSPPTARVLLLNGYNSNVASQHDWLAGWLMTHGCEVHSFDNHSFGRSTAENEHRVRSSSLFDALKRTIARWLFAHGKLGYVRRWDDLVDDVCWYTETLREERGHLPTVLYGESMGGALALCAQQKLDVLGAPPLAGLILSAPMCSLGSAALPHPLLVALGSLLAWIIPTVPAPFLKDLTDCIFRNVERRAEALRNPYRLAGPPRIGTAFAMKAGSEAAARAASRVNTPLLLLHGTNDVVCPPAASLAVFNSCKSQDKTLIEYESAWHALWAETVDTRRRLLADVLSFLATRTGTSLPHGICPDGSDPLTLSPAAHGRGLRLRRPLGVAEWRDESAFTAAREAHLHSCVRG